jgi:diaminopimelate epimerase
MKTRPLSFSKMHGAGNDFVLLDGFHQTLPALSPLTHAMCDRHFGIGADGLMAASPSNTSDIRMAYFNSDGSEGEMCGNGIRCFAKFAYEKGLTAKTTFTVETRAGEKEVRLKLDAAGEVASVSVDMGRPLFSSEQVPTILAGSPAVKAPIDAGGRAVYVTALRMGVPHCVILVDDMDATDVDGLGRIIESHPAFPEKVNVNFMQVISPREFIIKTYERGAGHTLACGTGCCSCAAAGRLMGILESEVTARAEGGTLFIRVSKEYELTMEGPAAFICDGVWPVRE